MQILLISIKIRRKGKVGKSVLTGSLAGVGLSILTGAAASNDVFFAPTKTIVISSIFLVPLGSGIGALAGIKKEKFEINGYLNKYILHMKAIQVKRNLLPKCYKKIKNNYY